MLLIIIIIITSIYTECSGLAVRLKKSAERERNIFADHENDRKKRERHYQCHDPWPAENDGSLWPQVTLANQHNANILSVVTHDSLRKNEVYDLKFHQPIATLLTLTVQDDLPWATHCHWMKFQTTVNLERGDLILSQGLPVMLLMWELKPTSMTCDISCEAAACPVARGRHWGSHVSSKISLPLHFGLQHPFQDLTEMFPV